jgi:hypothetical protein
MSRRIRFRVWLAAKILPAGYGPCVTGKADAPRVRDVLH